MAAKRFWENSSGADPNHPDDDDDDDVHHHHQQQHNDKRLKSKPTFASVIGEVVMVNFLQNFCSALEPMLRKVVNEEVEHGLRGRSLTRTPSLIRIQALQPPPTLHLHFSGNLSLSIFTGTKILDLHGNPLQILLLDTTTGDGDQAALFHSSPPMKVEIVVLDGDFPPGERGTWSSEEFEGYIVKERTGKRPLLAGDLVVNMRDGFAPVGEIEFTDNSSWIRSRRFRVGARVVQGKGPGPGPGPGGRIREAISEPFVVKDHRGELYKKHHPPMLHDEVWRLEKIGKDGAFHKKLSKENIRTVQDFLKLSVVDPSKLRKILGVGMSEKMWEVTIKHAKTCVLGNKLYICRGSNQTIIILNPICQVVKAVINGGDTFPTRDLTNINRAYIENLVRDAYAHWSSLEEIDNALFNDTPLLLTQGGIGEEEYPNNNESMMMIRSSYHHHHQHAAFIPDGTMEGSSSSSMLLPRSGSGTPNMESINWGGTNTPSLRFNVSDSSSDGDDLTPLRPFFHEN